MVALPIINLNSENEVNVLSPKAPLTLKRRADSGDSPRKLTTRRQFSTPNKLTPTTSRILSRIGTDDNPKTPAARTLFSFQTPSVKPKAALPVQSPMASPGGWKAMVLEAERRLNDGYVMSATTMLRRLSSSIGAIQSPRYWTARLRAEIEDDVPLSKIVELYEEASGKMKNDYILLRIRVIFADVILSSQKPFSTEENKREDEKEEARATELVEAEPFADADVQDDTFQTPTKQTPLDSESPINTEATVGTSTIAVQEKRRPALPASHFRAARQAARALKRLTATMTARDLPDILPCLTPEPNRAKKARKTSPSDTVLDVATLLSHGGGTVTCLTKTKTRVNGQVVETLTPHRRSTRIMTKTNKPPIAVTPLLAETPTFKPNPLIDTSPSSMAPFSTPSGESTSEFNREALAKAMPPPAAKKKVTAPAACPGTVPPSVVSKPALVTVPETVLAPRKISFATPAVGAKSPSTVPKPMEPPTAFAPRHLNFATPRVPSNEETHKPVKMPKSFNSRPMPQTTPLFRTPAVRRSLFDPDSAVHSTPGVEDFPSRLDQDLDAERQFLEEGSDVISEIENLDLASVLMNALLLSALCLGPQQERDPQLNL